LGRGAFINLGVLTDWSSQFAAADAQDYFWRDIFNTGMIGDTLTLVINGNPGAGWQTPTCPLCKTSTAPSGGLYPAGGWTLWSLSSINLDCSPIGALYSTRGQVIQGSYAWNLSRVGMGTGGFGGVITVKDASALDLKIDDGKPLTGSVIVMGDYSYSSCNGGVNARPAIVLPDPGCTNLTTNSYVTTSGAVCNSISNTTSGVDMLIKAPF
jgi:hypothetical protein